MYEVPDEEKVELAVPVMMPTNADSIQKAWDELDLELIKIDFAMTYLWGLKNKIKIFFSKEYRLKIKTYQKQLNFLLKLKALSNKKTLEEKVYILLGGMQYITARLGEFPDSGPLFELMLKKDDLQQIISENIPEIKLEKLLENPYLITDQADKVFIKFLAEHPDIHKAV